MTTSTSATIASDFAAEVNAAIAAGKVTKLPDAPAKGLSMRDAAQTLTKPTKAQKQAGTPTVTRKEVKKAPDTRDAKPSHPAAPKKPANAKRATAAPKAKATKAATPAAAGDMITPAAIAAKYDLTAKALRARMRKHADKWSKLLSDADRAKGTEYRIRNNQANWKAIDALMAK